MLAARIIPCLDVSHGRVVKGVKFQDLRDAGDPAERAARYERDGADEIVILDVSATPEGRGHQHETVGAVRKVLSIPLTVGGGVRTAEDALALLEAGADKVAVNSAAVERPALLSEIAERFGRQCCVLAIDAALHDGRYEVVVNGGRKRTGQDAIAWAEAGERRGAGEILLTSWDRDGTREGFELELTCRVASAVQVPVIASGGADSAEHIAEGFMAGADAVLAASIFHDGDTTPYDIKLLLQERGIRVRP